MIELKPLVNEPEPEPSATPEYKVHGRIYSIIETVGEIIFLGDPGPESSYDSCIHSCDQMGCGQSHVLWRYNKELKFLYGEAQEPQ